MTGDALTALARETQALSAVLHELEPADLARATNCPPWDLQELVVHIGASIWVGDAPFPVAEPHEELTVQPTTTAGLSGAPRPTGRPMSTAPRS